MTEQPETTDIYKHIMNAPRSKPLTLSSPMLALLRDWMHGEVVVLAKLSTRIANLEAELAQQKKYTNSAVEYAEKLDNHDTEMNAIIDAAKDVLKQHTENSESLARLQEVINVGES